MTEQDYSDLLKNLNAPQREAVCHGNGPLLVLAGAGSGKTRVLTCRIAYLVRVHRVSPAHILALTFTNKAAGEMKARVEGLLGAESRLWIGTFHSIFARILRREAEVLGYSSRYSIYDTDDSKRLVKNILKQLPGQGGKLSPSSVHQAISRYKNDLRSPEEAGCQAGHFQERIVAQVYEMYEKQIKENNAMDFDDLILKPAELFRAAPEVLERYRSRFSHILIDEYQDTNRAQYNLVHCLVGEERNICVVGDDDQSIYGWRGADIRNILEFERDFEGARAVRLEQNYRSTGNILEVANAVVSRNKGRKPKKLWTEKTQGARPELIACADELDEAEQIVMEAAGLCSRGPVKWRQIAVLFRTNAQSRALEDAFRKNGVPYRIIGGLRFYERREIKDLLAYLKVIANPQDSVSLYRIINVPARGVGPVTITRLTALANSRGEPVYHVLGEADQAEGISGAMAARVIDFHTMLEDLRLLARNESVGRVLSELIKLTGYDESLGSLDPLEAQGRRENIAELVSAAQEFSERFVPEGGATCIEAWLAETSLVSEIDFHNPDQDCVTLMTLHNAKGLEFPVVFIAGVEQNLLPVGRALEDSRQAALEEERRLFYVGITRAQERLFLSWAASRRRYTEILDTGPSEFLDHIPERLVERRWSPHALRKKSYRGGGRGSFSFTGATLGQKGPIGAAPPVFVSVSGQGKGSLDGKAVSEPVFERDPGVDEPAWRKGERVVHNRFGSGTIIEVSSRLDDLKVRVSFDSGETKKLAARFARLRRE